MSETGGGTQGADGPTERFRPFGETTLPAVGIEASFVAPMPSGASDAVLPSGVRKRRRSSDVDAPPDLDRWIQVLETQDGFEAQVVQLRLGERGLQTWLRRESFPRARMHSITYHQVLVPDGDDEVAEAEIAQILRERSEEVVPQPGDDIFLLQEQVDAELPGASKRERRIEYHRRRAVLDPGWAASHHAPLSPRWIVALKVILVLAAAALLLLLALA